MLGVESLRLWLLLSGTALLLSSCGDDVFAAVQDTSVFLGEQDMSVPYCFEFTWLGPKWDNTSKLNTTCKDFSARPCKEPLVITHDSSPPNTTFMWENFDINQISCKLTKGEACTKWVNYYGNEIENITYMCSKFTVEGVSKTNWQGCEWQVINSTTTEVCACRSAPGDMPCNAGPSTPGALNALPLLAALVLALCALAVRG